MSRSLFMAQALVLGRDLAALLRPRIGLLATAGAGTGWLLAGGTSLTGKASLAGETGLAAATPALFAMAGAFLLSCGVSALNQVQERGPDARMARTAARPLPSGRMSVRAALAWGLGCLLLASALLLATPGGLSAALLVPLAVLLYNGLYTPLKKRTSLAMLVGALAGALPPVVGFAAAGSAVFSVHAAAFIEPRILLLAGVFYAWQVPHFWLFARIHSADYQAAGFHVPHSGVGKARAPGALRLWLVCYGALMLLVPAFGLVDALAIKWLVAALALGLVACPGVVQARERLGFALVNASLALFLAFLAADALRLVG